MKTIPARFLVLSAVAIFVATSDAMAETIKFRQGSDGYTGTKDVELKGGKVPPDAFPKGGFEPAAATKKPAKAPAKAPPPPQATDASISVDLDNGGQQSQALIRFDDIIGNGTGQIPKGATVTAAKLTLYVSSAGGSRILVHRVLCDWDATNLTWDTVKLGGNTDGGIQADNKEAAAPFTTIDATKKGDCDIDILPVVKLWVSGAEKNFGLAFTCDSTNGWDFDSSETIAADKRPTLTITFAPPPTKTATK
jgi:hypothetical protein